jgi:hypothetical protein
VRERIGTDTAARHALQAVVPNGGGGVQSLFDVAPLKQVPLPRAVTPNAGEAVRLKFQTHGKGIGALGVRSLCLAHLASDAEEILYVMSDLMSENVGLRKITGSTEAAAQFLEKREVNVDVLVAGAVEGPSGRFSEPASGVHSIAKENEPGVLVRGSNRRESLLPDLLCVIKNEGNELNHLLLGSVPSGIRNSRARSRAGKQTQKVLPEDSTEDKKDHNAAQA